jgi:prokaryotic ubiquitin-like protein Pup
MATPGLVGLAGSVRFNDTHPEVPMPTSNDGGQKSTSRQTDKVDEVEEVSTSDVQERHEALTDDVDDILDEIDSVLETNAEEFVRGYIQKGGE